MKTITKNSLFNDYIIAYLERERNFVKESSYAIYTSHTFNKIVPYFETYKIKQLDLDLIQSFCNYLLVEGNSKSGGGLSYRTTKDIMIFLCGSIQFLFKQNITDSFDLSYKIQKSMQPVKIKTFDDYEVILLRDYLKNSNDPRAIGILIAMYSGLRIGEISALKWEDINLLNSTISINKTLQRIFIKSNKTTYSTLQVTSPKSTKSNRTIPINVELKQILINNSSKSGYVLSNSDVPIEPRALRYHFNSVQKKLNIQPKPFHSLRHTFATRLIKNTNDFKTVSELLGHSSISITLDIYTHTSEQTKKDCINKY